jgi:D-threo-aldose 1-dehydrogenase
MKARSLRDMAVTELGFGGASLGNLYQETSDAEARLAVDTAWDGGVRYYDTAPHYGLGLSERRLGAALAARPRDE